MCKMGLDPCVKKLLRVETKGAFSYYRSLQELYEKCPMDATVVDVNVELFKKPDHIKTGMDWAKWVFDHRVKNPPAKVVVLLFDSAPRVPHSKDLTHLQRSGDKRKRGFVPLPSDTLFGDNIELPDWSRVTGSKHLLPRVWDYLIGAVKRLVCKERFYDKSVFLDKPLCPKLAPKFKNLSGEIELVWKAANATMEPHYPNHLYGEGDMKTRAWVVHLQKKYKFANIFVLSTDLDNIAIFCDPSFKGVRLLGNTVGVNNGKVVPKKGAASSMHEVIDLGGIAQCLGQKQHPAFRAILCMGKTDFGWNIHKMTMDRMLKTFFWAVHNRKVINPKTLLESSKGYAKWHEMCHSKLCGNRASRVKTPLSVTQASIDNYLKRCQWIHRYWAGELQELGGPDPRDCPGYKKPTGMGEDLKEYGGKVRLVPS